MFLYNVLESVFDLEFMRWIFIAFAFLGVILCVKKTVGR